MVNVNAIKKQAGSGIYNFNGGINAFPSSGPYPGLGYSNTAEIRQTGLLTQWFWNPPYGQPRNVNVLELRQFGKSVWANSCTSYIKKTVKKTPWVITLKDEFVEENPNKNISDFSKQVRFIKSFLKHPNREGQTLQHIQNGWIDDICTLDAGVLVTPRDKSGRIVELWCRDGGSFLKHVDARGIMTDKERGYYQYSFQNPLASPIPFPPEFVNYAMLNPKSYSAYGESPLQWLLTVLEILDQGSRFNKEMFRNSNIPDGIVKMLNANVDQARQFQEDWRKQMTGQPHKLMFTNSDSDFVQLNLNNRDMEWLDGQKFYMKLVFCSYGVSPANLGFTEDVNKSSQEGQERTSDKVAVEPYFDLFESVMTNWVIPGILGVDPMDCPFEFKFNPVDHVKDRIETESARQDVQTGIITINEERDRRGLKPVEWGDQPMLFTQQDRFLESESNTDKRDAGKKENPKPGDKDNTNGEKQNKKPSGKPSSKVKNIGELERSSPTKIPQELSIYELYSQSLEHLFNQIFNEVYRLVDVEFYQTEKSVKKDLSSFFGKIAMIFHPQSIKIMLKPIIDNIFKRGISIAEKELKLDIGFGEDFEIASNRYTDEQIQGYEISGDGKKKWHGVKGVLRGYEDRIKQIVQLGINEKKGQKGIAEDIRSLQLDVDPTGTGYLNTKSSAQRIARTETNRLLHVAKLQSYKESGLEIGKSVIGPLDSKTSPICRRILNAYKEKTINLDKNFVDPDTMVEFVSPPFHPNCRHVMISKPLKGVEGDDLDPYDDYNSALQDFLGGQQ